MRAYSWMCARRSPQVGRVGFAGWPVRLLRGGRLVETEAHALVVLAEGEPAEARLNPQQQRELAPALSRSP
jgi:hypothetical protein